MRSSAAHLGAARQVEALEAGEAPGHVLHGELSRPQPRDCPLAGISPVRAHRAHGPEDTDEEITQCSKLGQCSAETVA